MFRAYTEAMIPPETNRNAAWLAVFWFLAFHELDTGRPFTFRRQADLARAVGVAPSVISRLKKASADGRAPWFSLTGKRASVHLDPNRC